MNVIDLEHRLVGCFGIVGGSIAAATGVGAGAQAPRRRRGRLLRRRRHQPGLLPRVPELRQGPRAAGRLRLREQPLRRVHAVRAGHGRARSPTAPRRSGMPDRDHRRQRRLDGAARPPPRPSSAPARGGGPQFVESLTYRYVGHSRSDPGKYRKPGELDEWKARDPLLVARAGARRALRHERTRRSTPSTPRSRSSCDAVVEARQGRAVPGPARRAGATEFKA